MYPVGIQKLGCRPFQRQYSVNGMIIEVNSEKDRTTYSPTETTSLVEIQGTCELRVDLSQPQAEHD